MIISYDIIMSSRFNVAAHQYVESLKTRKSESYEPDRKRSSVRSDPRLVVGNVRGQLRHRVDAEVATVRHDRGQHGADVLGRSLLALSRREERLSFAVEFDQPYIKPQLRSAMEVIPAPVGEGSILCNLGLKRWMYTYLNESTASIELRKAEQPWGPWSIPNVVTTAQKFPQLYGAFMTPSFLKDNGRTLYFVMSMFGPYNTFLMKATLITQ
jgi:hypothetical protein